MSENYISERGLLFKWHVLLSTSAFNFNLRRYSKALENGEDISETGAFGKARANELLNKMSRKKPYYNKNKSPICTFWLRNSCNRNDCPYRPCNGKAVQIEPIRPTLTGPGIQRLKLQYDEPLSHLAYKFNLRRYTTATPTCPS
jgi:hypothetical protein